MSNKNDSYIRNPKSNRAVKVGSATWRKLVKEGIIENDYKDPSELYEIQPSESQEDIQNKIKELNQELPMGVQTVRGRGKYKNKLVKRLKQPSTEEITKKSTKSAIRVVKNLVENQEGGESLHNLDEDYLEKLIMNEILGNSQSLLKPQPRETTQRSEFNYEIEEQGDFEEEEQGDFEEEEQGDFEQEEQSDFEYE